MRLLVVILLLFLTLGCVSEQTSSPEIKEIKRFLNISKFTILEEKETIIKGEKNFDENSANKSLEKQLSYNFEPNQSLIIFFIDVSYNYSYLHELKNPKRHGEAILLKKGDADILIDSGVEERANYLIDFLFKVGVDDIELYIATHGRKENYGGMRAVFGNFSVETLMWNNFTGDDENYYNLIENLSKKVKRVIIADYLMNFSINGIDFIVLNPKQNEKFLSIDNDGIVLKIIDRNFCLLTTGDITAGAQLRLSNDRNIEKNISLQCKVLQIPNYGLGAGSGNIDIFLDRVKPTFAVITGSFFDPYRERQTIISKLKIRNIDYFSTFDSKEEKTNIVKIKTNGEDIFISNFDDEREEIEIEDEEAEGNQANISEDEDEEEAEGNQTNITENEEEEE